jgi:lipoprotein NlpI
MKSALLFRFSRASILGAFALPLVLSAQTASEFITQGLDRFQLGDYDGAIAAYTKALELDARNMAGYNDRGLARTRQSNFMGALEDFAQAIKLKPGFAEAYFNRGTAEFLQGDFDAAIASNTRVIALRPDHQGAHYHRALAKACQGNLEGANDDFDKARQLKAGGDVTTPNYLLLHSVLVARRIGQGKDGRLIASAAWKDGWARSLAQFLNGELPESALLSRANFANDQGVVASQQGEALYFTGMVRLLAGDTAAARANLKKCVDTTGPADFVHRLAESELERR